MPLKWISSSSFVLTLASIAMTYRSHLLHGEALISIEAPWALNSTVRSAMLALKQNVLKKSDVLKSQADYQGDDSQT
jgi:hypothetical protein